MRYYNNPPDMSTDDLKIDAVAVHIDIDELNADIVTYVEYPARRCRAVSSLIESVMVRQSPERHESFNGIG